MSGGERFVVKSYRTRRGVRYGVYDLVLGGFPVSGPKGRVQPLDGYASAAEAGDRAAALNATPPELASAAGAAGGAAPAGPGRGKLGPAGPCGDESSVIGSTGGTAPAGGDVSAPAGPFGGRS